jgi:type VI secretion system secreted protein Hcp
MAAIDFFLKIDGIEGESADDRHAGEIDVDSWSWGVTHAAAPTVGSGASAGRPQPQDFTFVARISKASPSLFVSSASGEHLRSAVLSARRAGQTQEFLKLTMSEVRISSFRSVGGASDSPPMDEVSLAYTSLRVEYIVQRPDGRPGDTVADGWDFKTNRQL